MTKYYRGKELLYDDGIASPHWVYHPTLGAKVVDASTLPELFAEGWYDNPAFVGKEPVGGDAPASSEGEQAAPNLQGMTKAKLAAHARAELGLELDPDAMTKAAMVEAILAAQPTE